MPGQSCCAVERIYVHRDVYRPFVDGFVALTRKYRLGNPARSARRRSGPMVRAERGRVRSRSDRARPSVKGRARSSMSATFAAASRGTPYLAPQVLVDVDHRMRVMTEETFGPVVGLMAVRTTTRRFVLMNDSRYGLTASIWTSDVDAAIRIGDRVETGTWFLNRCDYLDPALAWTGVKDSGRGCSLSRLGYDVADTPEVVPPPARALSGTDQLAPVLSAGNLLSARTIYGSRQHRVPPARGPRASTPADSDSYALCAIGAQFAVAASVKPLGGTSFASYCTLTALRISLLGLERFLRRRRV